jgi:NAD(P)-dependent dehydrogenase (short-subunit alcohol dehydrogenase family)
LGRSRVRQILIGTLRNFEHGMRVNEIRPGATATPMLLAESQQQQFTAEA